MIKAIAMGGREHSCESSLASLCSMLSVRGSPLLLRRRRRPAPPSAAAPSPCADLKLLGRSGPRRSLASVVCGRLFSLPTLFARCHLLASPVQSASCRWPLVGEIAWKAEQRNDDDQPHLIAMHSEISRTGGWDPMAFMLCHPRRDRASRDAQGTGDWPCSCIQPAYVSGAAPWATAAQGKNGGSPSIASSREKRDARGRQ